MSRPRFYVDERVGCIAARDSTLVNPDELGLHSDSGGVVKYWQGSKSTDFCHACGQPISTVWVNTDEDLEEARTLCYELNRKEEKE